MNEYRVTVEYHGSVTTEVEANSEDEARDKGIEEADEMIHVNLSVYDVRIRKTKEGIDAM